MRKQIISSALILAFFFSAISSGVQAKRCRPSGKLSGKEGQCNDENNSECCQANQFYTTFECSPKVTDHTPAILTLNSFQKNGDGGAQSKCDGKFHSDDTPVVALSTGWFDNESRCLKDIIIFGNGKSVKATVVDECDSTIGCDAAHDFQPPCRNNIVDGSPAVWEALGVPKDVQGLMKIFWTDA